MSDVVYPWRWLAEAVGASFSLRYPWMDEVREAAGRSEALCVLLPEAAGPLAGWAAVLAELVDRDGQGQCLTAAGSFREASGVLADAYGIEAEEYCDGRAADWARRFLAESRRQMPQVDTVPLLVVDADDGCASALQDLVQAQRDLGYPFARPVLLRRTKPPDWAGEVIRFGLPELVGNLHRITPSPERDLRYWTDLMVALFVVWEAGAVPQLADELWDLLRLRRTLSLRDSGFDQWLQQELEGFAIRTQPPLEAPLPPALAFEPLPEVDDGLWQSGAVAWQGDHFDVSPPRARLWIKALGADDARDSLRRRRLTNVPLARWLSAWATSVEESLRVAALQAGSAQFRHFLQNQPPRNRRNGSSRSRLEELDVEDDARVIDCADFGDLADFVARNSLRSGSSNRARLLEQCRLARNRVVHQRIASTSDFLHIAYASCWLK